MAAKGLLSIPTGTRAPQRAHEDRKERSAWTLSLSLCLSPNQAEIQEITQDGTHLYNASRGSTEHCKDAVGRPPCNRHPRPSALLFPLSSFTCSEHTNIKCCQTPHGHGHPQPLCSHLLSLLSRGILIVKTSYLSAVALSHVVLRGRAV